MSAIPPSVPGHPLANGRAGVAILALLALFGPLSVDLYLPSLPTIGRELGATDSLMQLSLTAFFAGFALGMPIYGPISDAVGRRPVIIFGLLLFIAASLLAAAATSAHFLVALRFLQALGAGASVVLARVMIRDIFAPDRQARMMSLVSLVTAVAPLIAPLLGGQLLRASGWRSTFLFLAMVGVVGLGMMWLRVPESYPEEKRSGLRLGAAFMAYGGILKHRAMWGSILCVGGAMSAMFAYIAGTPFVYIEYFGVPPQWYGVLFAANMVSQMVFTWTNARIVGRIGPAKMSRIGAVIGLVSASALLAAGLTGALGLWGIALPLLGVIGVTVLQMSNHTVMVMALFPQNAGAAAGLLTACLFGCGALSSMAVSLVHSQGPLGMCAVIFTCCSASALGTTALFRRTAKTN